MGERTTTLSVRVPEALLERLERLAERLDQQDELAGRLPGGRAAAIRVALKVGIDTLEDQDPE